VGQLISLKMAWKLHPQKNSLEHAKFIRNKYYQLIKDKVIIDPFAGVGTLVIPLKHIAKKIICIELEEKYVEWGKEYERYLTGSNSIEWIVGDSTELIDNFDFDIVITSPPSQILYANYLPSVFRDTGLDSKTAKEIGKPEHPNNPMGKKKLCILVTNKVLRKAEKKAEAIIVINQIRGYIPIYLQKMRLIERTKVSHSWIELYMKSQLLYNNYGNNCSNSKNKNIKEKR